MSGEQWTPIGMNFTPADVISEAQRPPRKASVSKRSSMTWKRMRLWYPNKLPEDPPADYCRLIDSAERDKIAIAFSNMRTKYVSWPPTFPEFALLFTEQTKDTQSINWPARLEKLEKYCRQRFGARITDEQWRRLVYRGTDPRGAFAYTAIHFPAIGASAALTVTLEEAGV